MNSLFPTQTFHAFDERALESDKLYKACIAKTEVAGLKVKSSVKKRAAGLGISAPTLRAYDRQTNVDRRLLKKDVPMSVEEIASLPETRDELKAKMRRRQQWFFFVKNDKGQYRPACLEAILGYSPSLEAKRHGVIEQTPLAGKLFREEIIGTEFIDLGGYVFPVMGNGFSLE
jgi:hypothetical protein